MRWTLLWSLTLAGCATTGTEMVECPKGECSSAPALQSDDEKAIRQRASFDMRCDADRLTIHAFDANSFGVEGCGKRVTYVNTCKERSPLNADRCTWVANALTGP
jgi:hypothetical protein